ncbi:MAG: right-handed parallel beta-helix repeat-containing protein [Candidatus Cloacimonetes bacterium]|nr:right-handed parallel beta-helix repeat-containing protein [Candidatus Cloacimonadota bacterium]
MSRFCFFLLLAALLPGVIFGLDVSGDQSGTWIPANNPYSLVGDVTIPQGQSLILMPGVLVQAMGNFQITALGHIVAEGTVADSIRFINGQAPSYPLWKGIRLENTAVTSSFSYCYIEYGEYGINSISSPATIQNCHFNLNTKGIHAYGIGSANPGAVSISYCKVEYSGENGILISQNSNTTVSNCDVSNNGVLSTYRGAIQLANQSAGGSNNPHIMNNHIHHNRWQGITAWDIVGANAINPTIGFNIIEYNLTGIYLLNASGYVHDNTISYNFLPGDMNSGAGVMVSGATSEPYFERNTVTNNFTGFYITNNALPCLGDLGIYHSWAQGENIIQDNVDALGDPHGVVCASYPNSANVIKAENNFWDADTAAEIAFYITDNLDSAALPAVDFEPFLIQQTDSMIAGEWGYAGPYQLQNPRVELVEVTSGEVLATSYPVEDSFEITVPNPGSYYLVVRADIQESPEGMYGAHGGIQTPEVIIIPGEATLITLPQTLMFEATETELPRFSTMGIPALEGNQTVFPFKHNLWIYAPEKIDYIYREGDHIYQKRQDIRSESGYLTFNLPPGSVYLKVANLANGDFWLKREVSDSSGTISEYHVFVEMVYADSQWYDGGILIPLLRKYDAQNNLVSQILFDDILTGHIPELDMSTDIYMYEDNFVSAVLHQTYILVEEDGTLLPLVMGNRWLYNWVADYPDFPTYLKYQIVDQEPLGTMIRFFWQAPGAGLTPWEGYHLYHNGEVVCTLPINEMFYELPLTGNNNQYHVQAFLGEQSSGATNTVTVVLGGTEDELIELPRLKYGPNPFWAGGQPLSLELELGKKGSVELSIYNLRGQVVQKQAFTNVSKLCYEWNGKDVRGNKCSAGLYLVKIKREGQPPLQRKIVLLK